MATRRQHELPGHYPRRLGRRAAVIATPVPRDLAAEEGQPRAARGGRRRGRVRGALRSLREARLQRLPAHPRLRGRRRGRHPGGLRQRTAPAAEARGTRPRLRLLPVHLRAPRLLRPDRQGASAASRATRFPSRRSRQRGRGRRRHRVRPRRSRTTTRSATCSQQARSEEIRAANAALPERQREVLALRELEELSYDEIAEIMEMNRNSVAQLISRARINLRDALRGTALASIATSSPDCERAIAQIAAGHDGQEEAGGDSLDDHVARLRDLPPEPRGDGGGRTLLPCLAAGGRGALPAARDGGPRGRGRGRRLVRADRPP